MKRIRFLLAVLTIATILSGCSGGEKSKPEPVAKLLKEFETKDHLDGTALARWMDCVAQATITANPEGYAIDIDKGLLGFQTIWCFQQDGWIYYVQDLQNGPEQPISEAVSLARTDGKTQTNINLSLDVNGVISSNSFERDPYWSTVNSTYQRCPLVDVLAAEGIEILRSFPDQFSGSLNQSENEWTITWMALDPDALYDKLSGSRFAKSGFSTSSQCIHSWTMTQEGVVLTIETTDIQNSSSRSVANVRSLREEAENKSRIVALFDQYPVE